MLLDASTDVNHVSSAVYTPLHIAVDKGNFDIVTVLLDQDVNVHSVTTDGKTPLHIAVDRGDETIIQKLLKQKADASMKDVLGNTSLHLAVQIKQEASPGLIIRRPSYVSPSLAPYRACNAQTVQSMIDHGADVNAVNNRGQTALWFACADGQEGFVKILLDAGADPNITDNLKDSSLHSAINGHCSIDTVKEIIAHGAHVNAVNNICETPLLVACSTAQEASVKLLLKAKADPNIANVDGYTSLHSAIAAACSNQTLQEILNYGVEVNTRDKRGRTALLLSCFYRQMDSVKVLLKARADPSIADEDGFSCLHAAIDGRCNKGTLQALIDHGAHIDATRKDGTNALLRACTTGQSESVMCLLEAGADVNITKPNGDTCLHTAVKGGCCKGALQKIIELDINVSTLNNRGETPLFHACLSTQGESVKLLLEKGADPNITYADLYTSLHAAVLGHCTNETLQDIINHGVYLDAQNIDGETALWLACSNRQQDSVKILLEAGSNPNIAAGAVRYTSLHVAVHKGCRKNIIFTILYHGADVNAKTLENETALMLASMKGNKDAIDVLLNAGADPNIADANGHTCLSIAVYGKCRADSVQAIIDCRGDVNTTDKRKITVLMWACVKGNKDAINVLLNGGADPNIADATGDTCLNYAARNDCCTEVFQAIISNGGGVNATNKKNVTALMQACVKGNKDTINVLLNAGADPTIADASGDTCLNYAARNDCCTEVFQAIISHGGGVNATNKKNVTPLMRACVKGNKDAIKVLLNDGADPNIADVDGNTCLHYAARNDCCTEGLQAIISHGGDVNATNKKNVTPLMIVCRKRNKDAINVLLNAGANPNIVWQGATWCPHAS